MTKIDHYTTRRINNTSTRVYTHSTYHPHLDFLVKTKDGELPSSTSVNRSYYDSVAEGQVKNVRYRRGRLQKPFGSFELINKAFGFGGKEKVYIKAILK